MLPPESIAYALLEALLSDWADLDEQLLRLARLGWIDYEEEQAAFRCSPVVQSVVLAKLEDVFSLCEPLITYSVTKVVRGI